MSKLFVELRVDGEKLEKLSEQIRQLSDQICMFDILKDLDEIKARDRDSRRWAEDPLCLLIDEDGYPRFHALDELRWNLACALESLAEWVRPRVY